VSTPPELDVVPCFLNARAGTARAAAEVIGSDKRFRLHECEPASLLEAVREEIRGGARRVLVAGGDGTIASAAAELVGSDVELAIVPGGTLNHFSRSLGIPEDLAAAIETAATCPSRPVDVGFVNDRLFLNTSSVGAYAGFVHVRERWEPRLGYRLSSLISAVRTLARLPSYAIELEAEGETRRYRTPLVFVGVGERELQFPHFGERVAEGRTGLHVIAIHRRARSRLVLLALAAVTRGLRIVARTPHLDAVLVDSCTIELPLARAYLAIDGETVRLDSPLRYRLARGALRVAAPPEKTGG
jgi:diacylglycerol kinase family enzyme